jgi:hypothetical protein
MRPCRVTQERAEGPSTAREHTMFRSGAGRSAIRLPFFSFELAKFRGHNFSSIFNLNIKIMNAGVTGLQKV